MKQTSILLGHGVIGWALCGATIGIGQQYFSMDTTLLLHALAAPIIFAMLATVYTHRFQFTSPLGTAVIFLLVVVLLDVFLVAWLIQGSFEMFSSVLGTWLPFGLIFLSSYLAASHSYR